MDSTRKTFIVSVRDQEGPATLQEVRTGRKACLLNLVAAVALLVVGALDAPSAFASSDPCTITLSNPGTSTGGSSRDVICGTSGNDTLKGRGGADELRGKGGNDRLFGDSNRDELLGGSGNDELNGGPDNDTLKGESGFDDHFGDDGNDFLFLRDGELDDGLGCNAGIDTVDLDLVDSAFFFDPVFLLTCEAAFVGAVDEGPNVAISDRTRRVGGDGRTTVKLRCPASLQQPPRCKGKLKLQLRTRRSLRRTAPKIHYSLRPGKTRGVEVRLTRRDRHRLHRHGSAEGVVTSVEAGQHGDKTTVQTIKLRARP